MYKHRQADQVSQQARHTFGRTHPPTREGVECANAGIPDDTDPQGAALQVEIALLGFEDHVAVLVGPPAQDGALHDLSKCARMCRC